MEIKSNSNTIITITAFSSPLGPMLAGATSEGVCILEFTDRIRLENELTELQKLLNAVTHARKEPTSEST